MNKKLLILGLIVIVATGFYMNNLLFENDNFQVTSFGTAFDVPCDDVKLINSENGTDVFGYYKGERFYFVVSFNATENPDLYLEFQDMICKGKKYEENGVVFYEQTSQVLGNNFNIWTGVNLAIKDQTIAGSFIKNDTTGECIVCISNYWANVVDTLEDVDWGDKTITVNTNSTDDTEETVNEPVEEETVTGPVEEATSHEMYKSQFNQKDGEPKGATLKEDYIESTGASNGKELQEYMESHVPDDYK